MIYQEVKNRLHEASHERICRGILTGVRNVSDVSDTLLNGMNFLLCGGRYGIFYLLSDLVVRDHVLHQVDGENDA